MNVQAKRLSVVRLPIWLNLAQRLNLADEVRAALDRHVDSWQTLKHLTEVLLELEVVGARDTVWPVKAQAARKASGRSPDTLPVRMSGDEIFASLALLGLERDTRVALIHSAQGLR